MFQSTLFFTNNKPFEIFSDKIYIEEFKNVVTGNDVWIANGALIMRMLPFGNRTLIVAKFVATKDVEPYFVVGD